jgi:predicted AAA+ superfamily ATPase
MAKGQELGSIPETMVMDRMKFENPWWVTQSIDPEYSEMRRRLYFELFTPLVSETSIRRAVVLMGPRRVGKTVMMHHTIQHLITSGISPQKIAFVSIDNPIYLHLSLDQLFAFIRKAAGQDQLSGWYIFFDEIQYLKDWEVHLKVLVDSYSNTKFIVSGSSAAALRLRSQESGAGRFTEFMLPPLTFQEYIHLKNYTHLILPNTREWKDKMTPSYFSPQIKEVNRHFVDYINFGGYPEVIFSERMQSNPGRYIKNDIVDKVLLRDLPSLYGIRDVQELNSFFTMLAYHSGKEVSLDELSKNSNVEKALLKKYLEYLEAAFLIRIIHRIDNTAKRFQRAMNYKII